MITSKNTQQRIAKAFAPANISCIFRLYNSKRYETTGSIGAGFTLSKGVITTVQIANKTSIQVNNKIIKFPTVASVIENMTKIPVRISIKSYYPFGCGFGMSAASALSVAYALNKLLKLNKTKKEIGLIAHVAEVKNKTGRGDVGGQFNGGCLIKTQQGKPLNGKHLYFDNKMIYYRVFAPIDTKTVITNPENIKKINVAGDAALKKLKKIKNIKFKEFIKISKQFAVKSGLMTNKNLLKTLKEIETKGGAGSMIMLGHALFSNIPFSNSKNARLSNRPAGEL